MENAPYRQQILQVLPRMIALFDTDRTSNSYGMGDRYYWAWGLIDFGNGTFQGAAHGFARLWSHGLWPYATSREKFIQRIDALFQGAARLTRKDGSMEEAFPNEGSFCVTALVAFDLLSALDLLQSEIDRSTFVRWLDTIRPMIGYISVNDETHAIISNHLATAVAALVRWHRLTQERSAETRARQLLDRILRHQSHEGWFKEYEGADPGYQSLCTYYLADVHQLRPDWKLLEPLRISVQFLWHFAHPDGSFGGVYGSRCTRFYYPAGLEVLARDIPEALSLAGFMRNSIYRNRVVSLSSMDEPNLVPMFNAYCWAATFCSEIVVDPRPALLPACNSLPMRKHFEHAGLLIDRGPRHYSIISVSKGGVVHHFVNGKLAVQDAGVVVRCPRGRLGSTQAYASHNILKSDGDSLTIRAAVSPMPKRLPGPMQFLMLRILCLTAFRMAWVREWVKQWLVNLLITGVKPWPITNERLIILGESLSVEDKMVLPAGYERLSGLHSFVPIHMASQGYWQVQDEEELS